MVKKIVDGIEYELTPEELAEFNAYQESNRLAALNDLPRIKRLERNQLLLKCDWTQMPDYNGADKAAWATYRQALRDIPQQPGFPENITWPVAPDA